MMLCFRITTYGRIPLVIVGGNLNDVQHRDEILQQHIPFIQTQRYTIAFQQDNARQYIARVMMDRLECQCTAMPCRFDNARTSHTAE